MTDSRVTMTSYDDMTKQQAVAALEEFLDERDPALRRLRELLAVDGLRPDELLDGTPDSLTTVWRWAKSRLRRRKRDNATENARFENWLPTWSRHTIPDEPTLSYDTILLLDGVIAYFCRVIEAGAPQAGWRVGHHRVKSYHWQNYPVLGNEKEEFALTDFLPAKSRAHLKGVRESPDDELTTSAISVISTLRGEREEDRVEEPLVEVDDLSNGRSDERYDFEVNVQEEIAHEHSALVDSMVRALAEEPGVSEAFREDRERVLVTAPDWSGPRLANWFTSYLSDHLNG